MDIYQDNFQSFEIGRGNVIIEGSDATIIACGLMVQEGIKASEILKKEYSISCKVVDMYSIKPIDINLISASASETGAIITLEEHNIIGGLGSAVCEVTAENYPVPVKRLGVMDTFGESARDEELGQLLSKYGLKSDHVVESVIKTRRKSKK
jgi:transketolase